MKLAPVSLNMGKDKICNSKLYTKLALAQTKWSFQKAAICTYLDVFGALRQYREMQVNLQNPEHEYKQSILKF